MPAADSAMTPSARRILDTASQLFYDRGIHAVGVDLIAESSGVTKRTLYNRFGSKESLVVAYLQHRHEAWWAFLQDCLGEARAPRVLTVFDAYAASPLGLERGCAFLNGAGELPAGHPGLAVIRAHKSAVRDLVAELLAEDLPAGSDGDALAEHVFLLLEGGIAHRGLDQDVHRLREGRSFARDLVADAVQHARDAPVSD